MAGLASERGVRERVHSLALSTPQVAHRISSRARSKMAIYNFNIGPNTGTGGRGRGWRGGRSGFRGRGFGRGQGPHRGAGNRATLDHLLDLLGGGGNRPIRAHQQQHRLNVLDELVHALGGGRQVVPVARQPLQLANRQIGELLEQFGQEQGHANQLAAMPPEIVRNNAGDGQPNRDGENVEGGGLNQQQNDQHLPIPNQAQLLNQPEFEQGELVDRLQRLVISQRYRGYECYSCGRRHHVQAYCHLFN